MKYTKSGNTVIIRLDIDDEIYSSILHVCEELKIKAGKISGIGAVKQATFGVYDIEKRTYDCNEFHEFMELTSLLGNASVMNGKAYVHLHATVADEKGKTYGGHLKSAIIGATGEIFIDCIDGEIGRVLDEKTGINIFKI